MAYTNEQKETLLSMLEHNLGLDFTYYDSESKATKEEQLWYYVEASIEFIEREGIKLDYEKIGDLMLITMYATYLYEKRFNGVSVMPRSLRYNLNNRLFAQKAGEDNA